MVANYSILVERGGGPHFLFHSLLLFGLNFNQSLGGILWPFCHKSLGMSIPGHLRCYYSSSLGNSSLNPLDHLSYKSVNSRKWFLPIASSHI